MPQFIFVRHATAVNREKAVAEGISDRNRPLTSKGVRDFKRQVLKNKKIFKNVDLWVTSPYVRARETLDVILEALDIDEAQINIVSKITPEGKPQKLSDWIKKRKEQTIVFISHEPFLSDFLNRILNSARPLAKLKKGAIVIVEYSLKTQKYKLKDLFNP